jgi:hypothetical protein
MSDWQWSLMVRMRRAGYALMPVAAVAFAAMFPTAALAIWQSDVQWGFTAALLFMLGTLSGLGGGLMIVYGVDE